MIEEFDLKFSETSKKKQIKITAPWYYLGFIGEIGFAISLPIAGGALAGVIIDRTWETSPIATLSLLFLGVIISFFNLFKTVETITKQK